MSVPVDKSLDLEGSSLRNHARWPFRLGWCKVFPGRVVLGPVPYSRNDVAMIMETSACYRLVVAFESPCPAPEV